MPGESTPNRAKASTPDPILVAIPTPRATATPLEPIQTKKQPSRPSSTSHRRLAADVYASNHHIPDLLRSMTNALTVADPQPSDDAGVVDFLYNWLVARQEREQSRLSAKRAKEKQRSQGGGGTPSHAWSRRVRTLPATELRSMSLSDHLAPSRGQNLDVNSPSQMALSSTSLMGSLARNKRSLASGVRAKVLIEAEDAPWNDVACDWRPDYSLLAAVSQAQQEQAHIHRLTSLALSTGFDDIHSNDNDFRLWLGQQPTVPPRGALLQACLEIGRTAPPPPNALLKSSKSWVASEVSRTLGNSYRESDGGVSEGEQAGDMTEEGPDEERKTWYPLLGAAVNALADPPRYRDLPMGSNTLLVTLAGLERTAQTPVGVTFADTESAASPLLPIMGSPKEKFNADNDEAADNGSDRELPNGSDDDPVEAPDELHARWPLLAQCGRLMVEKDPVHVAVGQALSVMTASSAAGAAVEAALVAMYLPDGPSPW